MRACFRLDFFHVSVYPVHKARGAEAENVRGYRPSSPDPDSAGVGIGFQDTGVPFFIWIKL